MVGAMRRLGLVLPVVIAAIVVSACAVGGPEPPTDITDTSATLNGSVYSSVQGDTAYWFRYGETTAYDVETDHGQVTISDDQAHPVSTPISGLSAGTRHHWQLCVQDAEEDPPRTVCSKDQRFDTTGPKRYIALGDSLTQIGSATDQRYPERFFDFLEGDGAAEQLRNIGVSGATSGSLINDANQQLASAQQLIDEPETDTTVVTIDIGGNDILGTPACDPQSPSFNLTNCQPTLDQFATNFTFILESLNASLADDPGIEQLIALAYYNPWSGRSGEQTSANNAALALLGADLTLDCDGTGEEIGLNDHIACIAADQGAKLADVYPPFIGHGRIGDYFYDTIHPNDTGHQVVADTFQAAFGP